MSVSVNAPAVKGWCPGAHRPMMSAEGLVVRIRPPRGELTAHQASGLAALATAYGHGTVELTNRANLQIRGVAAAHHAPLIEGLDGLELLDADADAERHRNIVIDPFRPLGEDRQTVCAEHLAAQLRTQATGDADLARLPSKFGFVIDAGPRRQLAGVSGDIRIEAAAGALLVRADAMATGRIARDGEDAVQLALELARWFVASGGVGADGRGRMRAHLATGAQPPDACCGAAQPNPAAPRSQPGPRDGGLTVAVAFGQLDAADLARLAATGAPVLRITPYRMIHLPGVSTCALAGGSLILAGDDPLLRVVACTGAPGCPQASVTTRDLARAIAPLLAPHLPAGATAHVSGCAKGCALPAPAALTLVGRDGHFDLISHGPPWSEPARRGLTSGAVLSILGG